MGAVLAVPVAAAAPVAAVPVAVVGIGLMVFAIGKAFSSEGGLKPNPVMERLEDEAEKREDEVKKREERAKKREEEMKRLKEEAKRREEEAKKLKEEVEKREKEAKKLEEEAEKREEEAKKLKEEVEQLKGVMISDKPLMGPDNMPTKEDILRAKERHSYNDKCVNIAVCGRTRTGKSSLINAFRGYRTNDKGPQIARIGITETTERATSYPDPNPEKPFIWYDFPGAGTLNVPEWNYFNNQGLFVFDLAIVLFKDTLAGTDIAILRECKRFDIPSYLVRSHADDDIRKVSEELPGYDYRDDKNNVSLRKEALEKYKKDTESNVVKILKQAGIAQEKFYRISRNNITAIVQKQEPYTELVDEHSLLEDILKEVLSRRVRDPDKLKTL